MTISTDSITLTDKKTLQLFDSTQKNQLIGKIDSTQIVVAREYIAHALRNQYSTALNDIAWRFFEKVIDSNALMEALRWSKRSLEIYPQNDAFLDTYANLLYKLGRREEAILNETEALNIANKSKTHTIIYEKALAKMKSGEKTW